MAKPSSELSKELLIQYRPPALAYGGVISRVIIGTLLGITIPLVIFAAVIIFNLLLGAMGSSETLQRAAAHWPKLFDGILWMVITASTPLIAVFIMLLQDTRIRISKQAITFPLIFMPWLGRHRKLKWSEIIEIMAGQKDSELSKQNCIRLQLNSNHSVPIRLNYLSEVDAERLIGTIDYLDANCVIPSLVIRQGADLSFTQIWEEEMGRRMGNTTFIPLDTGMSLQDGQIRIIKQLSGHGRTASYLGRWLEKKLVVIKEVAVPSSEADSTAKRIYERFERECSYLLRLHHPKITRVLDHFVENNRNYILLEFIPGIDLRQCVHKQGPFSEHKVLDLSLQVVKILEYLHSFEPPIIHRDITPDNLILADGETVYLIDFGVANELAANVTGTVVGKQAYMAPEQVRGKATTQSDIYSLGATIYFLSTGQEPPALAQLKPRTVSPSTSEELNQLISNCTDVETSSRCPSVSQLAHNITALIDGSASSK